MWDLFVDWCSSAREDPQRCSVGVVLSFLQEKLEERLSPSTVKVYIAAIVAYHDAVDGVSLGNHHLIVRFLRGARRLNPPLLHLIPSWDLSVVLLEGGGPARILSQRNVPSVRLILILTLRLRPGYVPKIPTTPFREQVVNLQALPPKEADPALVLLCPVRQQKGNAVSKQRLARWVVDAIILTYHARQTSVVGWVTPNTFARFCSLRVEPISSRVLRLSCQLAAPFLMDPGFLHPFRSWHHISTFHGFFHVSPIISSSLLPRRWEGYVLSFIWSDTLACQHLYLNHVTQFRIVAFSREDPKYVSYEVTS
ncbi:hypothetical protein H4Q32_024717 [Labeo rohita]|uniref:Uncharacterized protein n=1 Tax=Labeo rohita TaxID=84645 RepID=A0ABQ8L3A9_LABRO|nr:hypothetical protein H4Q32_024717 [Labeo rohita]